MRRIRIDETDLIAERVVEEELPRVRDHSASVEILSAVIHYGHIVMHLDVNVSSTTGIPARVDCVKHANTRRVGQCESTEKGAVVFWT